MSEPVLLHSDEMAFGCCMAFNPDLLPRCHSTLEKAVADGISCPCCALETKAKIWGLFIVGLLIKLWDG